MQTYTHTYAPAQTDLLCRIMSCPKLFWVSRPSFKCCCLGLRGGMCFKNRGQRSGEGLAWQQTLTCYCSNDPGRLGKLRVCICLRLGGRSLTCAHTACVCVCVVVCMLWRDKDMFGIPRAASQGQLTVSARETWTGYPCRWATGGFVCGSDV